MKPVSQRLYAGMHKGLPIPSTKAVGLTFYLYSRLYKTLSLRITADLMRKAYSV